MPQDPNNLIWIDLEMTGLNTDEDYIIELATVVTDAQLNVVETGPVLAIHQSEAVLEGMDDWNKTQHTRSGLVERVRASTLGEGEAEHLTLEFLAQHVPPNTSPMCGNSICQDRRFLHRFMPALERYFHYRHIDVSTIKELARRWALPVHNAFSKDPAHQALDDIVDSIRELRHYRDYFLRVP